MSSTRIPADPSRVYAAAAIVPCDHRLARRALELGVETVRIRALREALARAIAETAGFTSSTR